MPMTLDGSFIIVFAFGFIQWFLWFLANRSSAPPDRPVRVHRYIAAFAGSRTSWVDCQNFAVQMGFFCIPFLHLLLYWSLAIDHLPVTLLLAVLMTLILHAGLYFYARIRLMAAEFLVLGFRELIAGEGENVVEYKPVCKHCGYQECVYNFAAMRTGGLPKDYHLALAVFPNLRTWVPVLSRKTADALRAAKVTGLILVPVGGSEPAGLYGLRSSHILPPIQGQSEDLPVLPFRTQNCEPDHGIEPPAQSLSIRS